MNKKPLENVLEFLKDNPDRISLNYTVEIRNDYSHVRWEQLKRGESVKITKNLKASILGWILLLNQEQINPIIISADFITQIADMLDVNQKLVDYLDTPRCWPKIFHNLPVQDALITILEIAITTNSLQFLEL